MEGGMSHFHLTTVLTLLLVDVVLAAWCNDWPPPPAATAGEGVIIGGRDGGGPMPLVEGATVALDVSAAAAELKSLSDELGLLCLIDAELEEEVLVTDWLGLMVVVEFVELEWLLAAAASESLWLSERAL